MATAEELEEHLRQYEAEQDTPKRAAILEKMRKNVLERNDNNDEFKTPYKNGIIRISQARLSELIEISRSMETIKRQKQREILNNEERIKELERNKYNKEHPYSDSNNHKI